MSFSRLLWAVPLSLVVSVFGFFISPTFASTLDPCQSSTHLTIEHPTTLESLHLTGQTVRIAAPLQINGAMTGCAARIELLPGGSLHAATIDVDAAVIALDGSTLTTSAALRLRAQTIAFHDSTTHPLTIRSGGGLALTGHALVDLRAVRHPASVVQATGDLVIRSAQPVRGDAHYLVGGALRIETLDGQPAAVYSPDDPIVLAQGDVSFGSYTGASLHVVAGGSVQLGAVQITGSDSAANTINPSNSATYNGTNTIASLAPVTLSNGTLLTIDGNTRATLDVRAGVDWSSLGGLPNNQTIGAATPSFGASATAASITITSITNQVNNSQVLLTNEYHPNTNLSGNITVGAISTYTFASNTNAGSISIDSRDDIQTGAIGAYASGGNAGNGGNVIILGDIVRIPEVRTHSTSGSGSAGDAGDILIDAVQYPLTNGELNSSITAAASSGNAGDITVTTTGPIHFFKLAAHSRVTGFGNAGKGGNITVIVGNAGALDGNDSLTVVDMLTTDTNGVSNGTVGDGGHVHMESADGAVSLHHIATFSQSGGSNNAGNGGNILVRSPRGSIAFTREIGTSSVASSNGSAGKAGLITLEASGNISFSNAVSVNASSVASTGSSQGAGTISMTAGGTINAAGMGLHASSSTTSGVVGTAGSINLNAGGSITLGAVSANSTRTTGAANAAGTIRIVTPQTLLALSFEAKSTGTSLGSGGTVDLDVGFLRVTDTTPPTSISTVGLTNTGVITITHDGNGVTPFVVGDATTNGTAKSLVSSSTSIVPTRSFLYSHTEVPNIHILSINPPLVVDAGDNQTVYEGLPVAFYGTTSATPAALDWDFGDGTGSTSGLTTGHTYADNGIFTVTLTVTSTEGMVSRDSLVITVQNVAPIVNAGADQLPMPRYGGSVVQFSGTYGDLGIADTHTLVWDFGDGTGTTGTLTPTHSYSIPGSYTVRLIVTDDDGGVTEDTLTVLLREGSFLFIPFFSNVGDL